jgi:hypothetical protein
MSWFPSTALNSAFDSFTDTVQTATKIVQDAIPEEQKEFLAKLTLNTDEMISERQNFRDEATRKEQAKSRLDKLLPWETLDLEREVRFLKSIWIVVVDFVRSCPFFVAIDLKREYIFFSHSHSSFYYIIVIIIIFKNIISDFGGRMQGRNFVVVFSRGHILRSI